MKTYNPILISTDSIKLSPALEQLTELLAKNTHDIWALQRIYDGWKCGPIRNDPKKNILIWFLMRSSVKKRKNMTGSLQWKL